MGARLLLLLVLALAAQPMFWAAERSFALAEEEGRRVALVIGNAEYQHAPDLLSPVNDAASVAEGLRRAGFSVIQATNASRHDMETALNQFLRTASGASLTLFYYSGHGIQAGGVNRIIPTDAELRDVADLDVETFNVDTILRAMEKQGGVQLMFLDACRNNPFAGREYYVGTAKARSDAGLAPVERHGGQSLLGFATEPGQVALDGDGALSPYTQSFLRNVLVPGTDLLSGLRKVRKEVAQATAGSQIPWESHSLAGAVFLMPESAAAIESSSDNPQAGMDELTALRQQLQAALPVKVGVGPVKLYPARVPKESSGQLIVQLVAKPRNGFFTLRRRTLSTGSQIQAAELSQVYYEPPAGAEGTRVDATWRIRSRNERDRELRTTIRPVIDACDLEAGEPLDPQGVTSGRFASQIDPALAKAACERAVREYPDVPRFSYQLARALLAEGRSADAYRLIESTAQRGHTRSILKLGFLASRGIGRPQDIALSAELYARSAGLGDPFGIHAYGLILIEGRGVAADPERGIALISQAAELGHVSSFNLLGALYYYGNSVTKDVQRALRYYRAGLEQKSVHSYNNLGLAYLQGEGVAQDFGQAIELFKTASDLGHPEAPNNIGRMFYFGYGVPEDLEEAEKWYKLASARGSRFASWNLGWIYQSGPEHKRNLVESAGYYALAVALDWFGTAAEARDALQTIDASAKRAALERFAAELGGKEPAAAGSDLDERLVAAARAAWIAKNPRMDLY